MYSVVLFTAELINTYVSVWDLKATGEAMPRVISCLILYLASFPCFINMSAINSHLVVSSFLVIQIQIQTADRVFNSLFHPESTGEQIRPKHRGPWQTRSKVCGYFGARIKFHVSV
jgi:hypothetical protein